MSDGTEREGRLRAWSQRTRALLHRQGDDEASDQVDSANDRGDFSHDDMGLQNEDVALLSSDALREELHAAVDAVMDEHSRIPRNRGALKDELDSVAHKIVDEHMSGQSFRSRLRSEVKGFWSEHAVPGAVSTGATVETTVEQLKTTMQGVYGGAKPGARRFIKIIPALIALIAGVLVEYVDDEKKIEQLSQHIEKLLVDTVHVKPEIAHHIVEVAVRVAKKLRERGSGQEAP